MAAAAGLTRAAARRFLLTLQALGYAEREGRYFRLRPSTLELGYAYLASQPWWRPAQRVAERLGAELRQACAVGVLDRDAEMGTYHVFVALQPLHELRRRLDRVARNRK